MCKTKKKKLKSTSILYCLYAANFLFWFANMFCSRLLETQEEDSEEYGSPLVLASAIADIIKSRTEALLKKTKAAVSPKPIVMRAEYAHCPNLTIIDTPGFVLKVSS